jgi:hypothetical protein
MFPFLKHCKTHLLAELTIPVKEIKSKGKGKGSPYNRSLRPRG